jgi:hypothetical protein
MHTEPPFDRAAGVLVPQPDLNPTRSTGEWRGAFQPGDGHFLIPALAGGDPHGIERDPRTEQSFRFLLSRTYRFITIGE